MINTFEEKPLRIYSLGRFSVVKNDLPLRASRKAPHKPLLLLKVLIASGSRQVSGDHLSGLMWPDKDGDLAKSSFDTTLHRLRKYLGNDSFIMVEDGRLSLNAEQVWVDLWAFERAVGNVRMALVRKGGEVASEAIASETEMIMHTYQGDFLALEPVTYWSVSVRERLRNKCIHCLIELGRYWEAQKQWHKAIRCYRKGIEVDDLVETFYQRLMVCLMEIGKKPEAIFVYRQCRQILAIVLGLEPMADTSAIYKMICSGYDKSGHFARPNLFSAQY